METKINIAAILKDKPVNTKLYSPFYGNCILAFPKDMTIKDKSLVNRYFYDDGRGCLNGEIMLFPSKEMRDWHKFSWKKGDVLRHSEYPLTVIFESFEDDTYTSFKCKYCFDFESANKWLVSNSKCSTKHFYKVSDEEAKEFIKKVELNYNGKLKMETLEIEKSQPEFKAWDAEKKMIVDLEPKVGLKPFDKVLVRDSTLDKWRTNLFGYIDKDGYYRCVYANWVYCIPYAGNENLLGTTNDVEG